MAAVFALRPHLADKADPALVQQDEHHLRRVAARLDEAQRDAAAELAVARRRPAGSGQRALDRDQDVHRLESRLRLLRRYSLDLCLGRTVGEGGTIAYIGRLGLSDGRGGRLLVDWRSPAAAPFFAATLARPLGLRSRRRYRWADGRVVDFWDEVLSPTAPTDDLAVDDDSAFLTGLAGSRSTGMRDVLGTIAADQDAIIRSDSPGALVVDGGPGTGKTVVALHRAAYLLHTDPRLAPGHGGVLFVGPHHPYLAYVADVLPSLGEEGVLTCTPDDLVPQAREARPEPDPRVAALKATLALVRAVDEAVAVYEEPPRLDCEVETPWGDVRLTARDWAEAFAAPGPHVPHNEARSLVWETLAEIARDRLSEDVDPDDVLAVLQHTEHVVDALERSWVILEPTDLIADLWAVPAYLRRCAPSLTPDEVRLLHREESAAWTDADLPLLDTARHRLGDPSHEQRARARHLAVAQQRAGMDRVVDDLLAAMEHDDGEGLWTSLRQEGLRDALDDESAVPAGDVDALAGPFAHVVVDEAQELTDGQWAMLVRRCPSHSLTIAGGRAQARRGFAESWPERLARVGLRTVREAGLTVNYRTPREVMAEAGPLIRAAVPGANVPDSIRSSGSPVRRVGIDDVDAVVDRWLSEHDEGTVCVIGDPERSGRDRVRSLSPVLAKGLEFDLVVLVDPAGWGDDVAAAVDRYVAMTRTTRELVIAE
ncbi:MULTISPECIES: RNA polymerase recycling motor ATPase HelR [unclassified Aeromicrobium]|uniref:RNA polymerase recycling motor ATPase HelR n=1 Tax=unclassified Aeromicrobium TaxID=2633570 RepID=UPI00396AEFDE